MSQGNRHSGGITPPSDLVVAALTAAGGSAHEDTIRDAVARARELHRAGLAINMAVLIGRVRRVRLADGSIGLELIEADR